MPPDGYETVTLPEALVERLEELDGRSHAETIAAQLPENGPDETVYGKPDLSEIRASLKTIEERTGSIERTLEGLQR